MGRERREAPCALKDPQIEGEAGLVRHKGSGEVRWGSQRGYGCLEEVWDPAAEHGAPGEEVFSLSTCCVSIAVLSPLQEPSPQRSTISITHPMNNRETS